MKLKIIQNNNNEVNISQLEKRKKIRKVKSRTFEKIDKFHKCPAILPGAKELPNV